jgi:hypothetical protein
LLAGAAGLVLHGDLKVVLFVNSEHVDSGREEGPNDVLPHVMCAVVVWQQSLAANSQWLHMNMHVLRHCMSILAHATWPANCCKDTEAMLLTLLHDGFA